MTAGMRAVERRNRANQQRRRRDESGDDAEFARDLRAMFGGVRILSLRRRIRLCRGAFANLFVDYLADAG